MSQKLNGLIATIVLAGVTLGLAPWAPPAAGAASRPAPATRSLGEALRADGTLNWQAGLNGNFDARGWSLATTAGGPPQFVHGPQKPASPGDEGWDTRFVNGVTWPGFASHVYAVAVVGNDVYVGGDFTQAGGIAAKNVARWNTTTHQWFALGGGIDGTVNVLVAHGAYIYAGGSFNDVEGQSAWSLARWNTLSQTWSLAGGSPGLVSGNFDGIVQAMVFDASGNLYVGGYFDHAGSVPAMSVVKWNGTAWSALGSGLGADSNNDSVMALAINGGDVYAGGHFTTPNSNIAVWNGSSWSGLGGTNGDVTALQVNGNSVYAGGRFSMAGLTSANHVAMWTGGQNWQALDTGTDDAVTSIVPGPGGYFVTGNFTTAGSVNARHIAFWDGHTWSALGNGADAEVFGAAVTGTDLYAGGEFMTVDPSSIANHIARWNMAGGGWYPLGNSVNNQINAVAISGSDVYLGGRFNSAGGVPVNNIAKWNSRTGLWSDLAGGVYGCTSGGCPTIVLAIAINGPDVYVGGNFTVVGNYPDNHPASALARWNMLTNTWVSGFVGNCLPVNCESAVYALAAHGSGVDAGGLFSNTACHPICVTANNVVHWDGASIYTPFSDGATNGTNDYVFALLYDGYGTYVGGQFTSPRSGLAYFDGSDWFGPGSGFNNAVLALAQDDQYLYAGGVFTNAGGTGADCVARLSLTGVGDWLPVGSGFNFMVHALAWRGPDLIAAGDFTQSGLMGLNHMARWNTTTETWAPIGSGTDDWVYALAASPNEIFAGGRFKQAGGKEAEFFSRWAHFQLFLPKVAR